MNQITVRIPNLSEDKTRSVTLGIMAKLQGIQSIKFDEKRGTMTVVGSVDSVLLVTKLRKKLQVNLLTVRPANCETSERQLDHGSRNYEGFGTYRQVQYVPAPRYSEPVMYYYNEQPSDCTIV